MSPGSPADPGRSIDEVSDAVVADLAAAVPSVAVYIGRPSERLLDDLSPDGLARLAELVGRTVAAAEATPAVGPADEVAKAVLIERLRLHLDTYEAGDQHANLNVIASPVQDLRMIFDLLPKSTDEELADVAARA